MEAMEEMKNLREKLPSGSALKALQNYDLFGDEIGIFYVHIIMWESQVENEHYSTVYVG